LLFLLRMKVEETTKVLEVALCNLNEDCWLYIYMMLCAWNEEDKTRPNRVVSLSLFSTTVILNTPCKSWMGPEELAQLCEEWHGCTESPVESK
jgi:hypothetical protein